MRYCLARSTLILRSIVLITGPQVCQRGIGIRRMPSGRLRFRTQATPPVKSPECGTGWHWRRSKRTRAPVQGIAKLILNGRLEELAWVNLYAVTTHIGRTAWKDGCR